MSIVSDTLYEHLSAVNAHGAAVRGRLGAFSAAAYAWVINPSRHTYDQTIVVVPEDIKRIQHVYPHPIPVYDPSKERWLLSYGTLSGSDGIPVPDLTFHEVVPLPDVDCLMDGRFMRRYLETYQADIKLSFGDFNYVHRYRK